MISASTARRGARGGIDQDVTGRVGGGRGDGRGRAALGAMETVFWREFLGGFGSVG